MADELKPALSAEEWTAWNDSKRLRRPTRMSADDVDVYGQRYTGVSYGWPWSGSAIEGEHSNAGLDKSFDPALIALANNALPADSPYKITRDDVRCLVVAAQAALAEGDQVIRIAAKLAALLPPEQP